MELNKKQIIAVISQEIDWHIKNKNEINMPDDYITGFISGLKQIKKVFKSMRNDN